MNFAYSAWMTCSVLALAGIFASGCSEEDPNVDPSGSGAAASGGSATGGVATGGLASGGATTGGASTGGVGTGSTSSTGGDGSGGARVELDCNDLSALRPATYEGVLQCVIEAGCQSSICHGGEVPLLLIDTWENFPRREDHSAYDTLKETLLNHRVAHCANSPIVDPGNPENSAIIKAFTRTCDDPEWGMPDGCYETPCVPQEYIDFVSEWISLGAEM